MQQEISQWYISVVVFRKLWIHTLVYSHQCPFNILWTNGCQNQIFGTVQIFAGLTSSVRMQVGSKLELYFQIWTNKTMHALATSAEHVNLDSLSPKKKLDSCPFLFFSFSVFQKKRGYVWGPFLHFLLPCNTKIHRATVNFERGKKAVHTTYKMHLALAHSAICCGGTGIHNLIFF